MEIERRRVENIDLIPENPYLEYPGKPVILGSSEEVLTSGKLCWDEDGNAILRLKDGECVRIPADHQLDRIEPTVNALLGNLTPGSKYEALFNEEMDLYQNAILEGDGTVKSQKYGSVIYYPERNDLVWVAPRKLRELAWLARNEHQFQDPEQRLSWEEQREIFGQQVIGVVGGSVGMNLVKRTRDILLPKWIKTADPDFFDDSNRNRVNFGYPELGRNKAQVVAGQLHATDPWLPVSVYSEGIYPDNINDFFTGNKEKGEPALTVAIEVCDDPDRKIEVGQMCRQNRIPLWRLTDFGNAIQVDYYPYDKEPDFPLAIGVSDEKLFEVKRVWKDNPANRDNFFDFAFALVGDHWRQNPEFSGYINRFNKTPFAQGIPQTSIASEGGASHTTLHIGSVLTGWKQPNRLYIDSRAGIQISEYQEKHFGSWILVRVSQNLREGSMTREVFSADTGERLESSGIDLNGNRYSEIFYDEVKEARKLVLGGLDILIAGKSETQELTPQK